MVALPPQFIDMSGWLLLTSDRQEVPTTLSLREQLLHADLKNLPDAYQELYWVAPSSYLGDQVGAGWQLDQ